MASTSQSQSPLDSSSTKELVLWILQCLDEAKCEETLHKLEKESGLYFNMKYFEDLVTNGEWEEVEAYLSGFTKLEDNVHSRKMFYVIREQKYLEALDRGEHSKATDILVKDLKVFSKYDEKLFEDKTMLLTSDKYRENKDLLTYGDFKSARAIVLKKLKELIETHPVFEGKLQFPSFQKSTLKRLYNEGLYSEARQHQERNNPMPDYATKTSFGASRAPSFVINPSSAFMPWAHAPYRPSQPAPRGFVYRRPPPVPHQFFSAGPSHYTGFGAPTNAVTLKPPRTITDNRATHFLQGNEVNNMPVNILPMMHPGARQTQTSYISEELPKTVVANLSQGSSIKSMEFHPLQDSLLLVGTNIGDISIWEVGSKELLVQRKFEVWNLSQCPFPLEISLTSGNTASVNRVIWSLDGELFGVAYSKHIVHIYKYLGGTELRNHLEIDAHAGNVSDLAFTILDKQLCIITCGDDKTIKVWGATSGSKLLTFEGHEAPVHSVCPYHRDNYQFLFSASVDGKIKAWVYDQRDPRADYNAPRFSSTRMYFSSDKTRLFSCGTNKERQSFIVEWDQILGYIKRSYIGLGNTSTDAIQFDTTRNKFLAAGDESVIKIWDMDNVNLLRTIDAEGGLPASPCIRFNKEGTLLAVSTADNGIKVLASTNNVRHVHSIASHMDSSGAAPGSLIKNGDNQGITDVTFTIENSKTWRRSVINDSSQLCALRLADHTLPVRITRLMYLTSGDALLALTNNANHKLWKWQSNDCNATRKATSDVAPQLMMLPNGVLMTNDTERLNPEDFASCFVLSKNNGYLMSTSGGEISIISMRTFKTLATFMPPPPTATSLAYHPRDINIFAIGMDDSTIQIYNVRLKKVTSELKGHEKRVTGLAFSNVLNVLVSSSANLQICIWSIDVWEKKATLFLKMPIGRTLNFNAPTRVQFLPDQVHLLAVHETQVAISIVPTPGMKKPHIWRWFHPKRADITDAACSCDSKSVFVSSADGSVSVLDASTLMLRCIINQSAYLPSNSSNRPFPVALAAHPSEPNQFALGLSDGWIHVLEPLESKAKRGTLPPPENG
ncbi:topless-related protein 4-like isoform X2 [Silene latifolia]|uniref:topless-related protein 4-like isoform X2 n=1 Tax=Silene latifolia TaxID=37657 RepID=UPI003D779B14